MIRQKLLPIVLLALATACGGDLPAAFLHVEAAPGTPPLDTLDLRFLGEDGSDAFRREAIPLGGLDLVTKPYTVRVETAGDSPFAAPVRVGVVGLVAGQPVATWTGTIDLSKKAEQTVRLAPLAAECDRDGDGFKDCATAGCCTDGETPFADCNDDSDLELPFAEDPLCRACADTDGDSVSNCVELSHEPPCDADQASSYPGAPEICDSRDNDCDGDTDEGLSMRDWDGRVLALGAACGTGVCKGGTVGCSDGKAACSTASLQASEIADDGLDNDCNGATDEGGVLDDTDGDGTPDVDEIDACDVPNAELLAEVHPGAAEPCCPPDVAGGAGAVAACDLNCDGQVTACGADDHDHDGYGAALDCDDDDPLIHPEAPEKCDDGVDQDCDGGDTPCTAALDADGDGYLKPIDCDDGDDEIHPGAVERCNGVDDDCDGLADEGNPEASGADGAPTPCGTDVGECVAGRTACHHVPGELPLLLCLGNVPPAAEACNARDDDCDGQTDEELDAAAAGCLGAGVCADQAIGQCVSGEWTCPYAAVLGALYEAPETSCDALDNDCDGQTDEELSSLALSTCKKVGLCLTHLDEVVALCDGGAWSCAYPFAGYEATEASCDGLDNDCDGQTDEDLALTDWDGASVPLGAACGTGACAEGLAACADDGAVTCSTAALAGPETCNGADDDCDGGTDEGYAWDGQLLGEGCDGEGACGVGVVECLPDGSTATCSTNPDGTDPGDAAETCNQEDDDCDGQTDEGLDAASADATCLEAGVCTIYNVVATCVEGGWTCDYSLIATYEAGAETSCDDKDNDCDGETDEDVRYVDPSGTGLWLGEACDGVGACGTGVVECGNDKAITCSTNGNGSATEASPEACNGADDDCDGQTDEPFTWNDVAIGLPCDGVGECATGVVECMSPSAATCSTNPDGSTPDVGAEVCNLQDDDCDGQTDEGLDAMSADAPCLRIGVCTTLNVVASCVDGDWVCDYGNIATYDSGAEVRCDGLDNDCDGQADEDFAWTDPVSGQQKSKGAACGSGACADGVVVCAPEATGLACSTDIAVDFEVCDGQDNDCDGQTDEGLRYTDPTSGALVPLGEACDGEGACGGGVVECSADKIITCSTNADGSTPEDAPDVCDGVDNDCDGQTDEELTWHGVALGEACDGLGVCGIGVVVCAPGAPVATCSTNPDGTGPGDVPETCNNQDDDCDDLTDEELTVDDSPCRTVGVCAGPAVAATCGGGDWVCDYSLVPGWQAGNEATHCDGLDNDCDGSADEDFSTLGDECDGDDPDLCTYGVVVCAADKAGVTCLDSSPAVEACNGVDDDCDDLTDEPGALDCTPFYLDLDGDGFGRTGDSRCQCGPDPISHYSATVDGDCDDTAAGADVNPDAPEICNAVDDDCDSLTDAADADLTSDDQPMCELQAGVCAGATKPPELCAGGSWQGCTTDEYLAVSNAYQAATETTCDGQDNDCDASTDEDFSLPLPDGTTASGVGVTCGVGACAGGTTACRPDATGIACPTLTALTPEVCDGQDNDCDGTTDAADADLAANDHPACALQVGVCLGSTKPPALCSAGTWLACTTAAYTAHSASYQAAVETACDSKDNDCDGSTDEDFSLVLPDGATVAGVGTACGTGDCAGGVTACNAGKTGLTCPTLANATPEMCGGGDDDCDGKVDAADPDLAQNDAPACEKSKGVCAGLTKPVALCTGGAWAACDAALYLAHDARYEAGVEVTCDGVDNDCDDAIDDDFPLAMPDGSTVTGANKACGTGDCAGGVTACNGAKTGITCPSLSNISPETCNGDDDDCDGKTDATDPDLVRPLCANQQGVCKDSQPLAARCSGGYWASCTLADYTAFSAAYKAGPEIDAVACDGFDNNCNNQVDEDYVAPTTTCGTGACAKTGALACVGGALIDTCTPGSPAGDDSVCNKIDDDCDTLTDEEFPAGPSTCGVGACARVGVKSCTNGVPVDTCAPGSAAQETCNGADDDCDGLTDAADTDDVVDGRLRYDHPACSEQDGVCAGAIAPARVCIGGSWHACDDAVFTAVSADYQAGAETTCDGLDNDCDGNADEDFSLTLPDGSTVTGIGTACGFGACLGGTTECTLDHLAITCPTLANLGPEVCGDGDEDCDGKTDEYLGAWTTDDLAATQAGGIPGAATAANGTVYATWHHDPTGAKDLYFGENPGSGWTVTPIATDHAVGTISAIAVATNGNVHVLFNDDDTAQKKLRVITRVGTTWGSPVTIDGGGSIKITVSYVSVDIDAANALHVAYYVSDTDKKDLRYATNASGSWVVEEVEPGNVVDVGNYAAIRISRTGWPIIAYADQTSKLVKVATRSDTDWTIDPVTQANSATNYSISLALDADDVPYVTYWDSFLSTLNIARRPQTTWISQVIESSVSAGQYGSSVVIDADGALYAAYHVLTPGADLHYASAEVFAGPWSTATVDTTGATGRYPRLVLTPQGRVHVVHETSTSALRHSKLACP